MTGTATTMSIEENMAIAARRGKSRGLRWGITKRNAKNTAKCFPPCILDWKIACIKSRSVIRWTASGNHASDGFHQKPKLLLLDEHTAALDPKTAAKVLEISDQIISENHLTAMMVTHNMKDAIAHGNRLIMMHEGKVILNIAGEAKRNLRSEICCISLKK